MSSADRINARSVRLWLTIAVCVGALLGMVAFFYSQLSPPPDLSSPPDEQRRVVHPAGYSIICPERMRADVERETASAQELDSIDMLPDGGRSRYSQTFSVRRLRMTEELRQRFARDGFADGEFQGQSALVRAGPSGKYDIWAVVFQRGEHWFEISLLLPDAGRDPKTLPPEQWKPYVESFRVESVNARDR